MNKIFFYKYYFNQIGKLLRALKKKKKCPNTRLAFTSYTIYSDPYIYTKISFENIVLHTIPEYGISQNQIISLGIPYVSRTIIRVVPFFNQTYQYSHLCTKNNIMLRQFKTFSIILSSNFNYFWSPIIDKNKWKN